jgi:Ala-tRNA(Pro) deacylase
MNRLVKDMMSVPANSDRGLLFERLASLGISATVVPHPIHDSVEEGKRLRGQMAGTFTKNLLLKDKKRRLFLFSIHEDLALDLKTLLRHVGASGRLGFAPAERMVELLGVQPGAPTPLGLIDDVEGEVTAVIDVSLMDAARVDFHPLVNTESIGLKPQELSAFIRSCGRDPIFVNFGDLSKIEMIHPS